MFIQLTYSMLGFMIAIRIFRKFAREFAFSKQLITMFECSITTFMCALSFLLHPWTFTLWIIIGLFLISLNLLPKIVQFFLEKQLKNQLISLLDQVILGMQSGSPFRSSFQRSITFLPQIYQHQFREIFNAMISSQSKNNEIKSSIIKEIWIELKEIDQSQNKVVDQLKAYRKILKMEDDFRRRSGLIKQQIQIQAAVMSIMFVSLFVFIVFQFGFMTHLYLFIFSSLLFSIGMVWIFLSGRKMKWNL